MDKSEAGVLGYAKTQQHMESYRKQQRQESLARFQALSPTCKQCITPLSYEQRHQRFCSQSCAAVFVNQHRTRTRKNRICTRCGGATTRPRDKFCPDCIAKGYANHALPLSELQTDSGRRRYLLRTRAHQCELCQITTWQGQPTPLVMDHIDGNPHHHTEANLRLICPNCDALLPTFKARNKGNGRVARRRQRSSDGRAADL